MLLKMAKGLVMDNIKTKSLKNIEDKMSELDKGSLRYRILESARRFKTSWISLGQSLYAVWKDKLYKDWGYGNFDIYTVREIGIRKNTAMKLLRSYYFLEKEEPEYLRNDYVSQTSVPSVPSYEAVDVLRMAKGKKTIDPQDYNNLKKDIFEKGRDYREVKKDLTSLIRQRQELEPEEAWEKKRIGTIRRLLGALKSLKTEAETAKILPAALIRETAQLIEKLETEIN